MGTVVASIPQTFTRVEQVIFEFLLGMHGVWRTTREASEPTVGWPSTSLRTHVFNMRKKLEGTDWEIQSHPGRGYRLVNKGNDR